MPELSSQDSWGIVYVQDDRGLTLPPQWDDALGEVCGANQLWWEGQEFLFRRTMRKEAVQTAFRIFRALVTEGEHSILGRLDEPGDVAEPEAVALYELSEEALGFTSGWVERLTDYDLKDLCNDLLESFPYGHKVAEIEYAPHVSEALPGQFVAPVDLAPKPRTVYSFRVDRGNRVLGVIPTGGKDTDLVPPANLVVMSVGGMDRDPRGSGILATIWENVEAKDRQRLNQRKSGDQIGGGFIWVDQDYPPASTEGELTPYVNTIQGVDEAGNPILKPVSRAKIAATEVAKLGTGKAGVGAPGQKARLLQSTGGDVFASQIDYEDRSVFRAFLGNAQIVAEAKQDSQAASGKAENVAETLRDAARGLLCKVVEGLFRTVLRLNFGDRYERVVPRYDIVTEEGNDFATVVNAMLSESFMSLPTDVRNVVAQRGGFGTPFADDDQGDPADTQDEDRIREEDEAQAEEEAANFAATFPQSGPVTFATRVEIANGAAQKRIGGKSGVVPSTNRQFRSLVTRLKNGKLTEEEFVERSAYTLRVAHERAYSVGFAHGGGSVLKARQDAVEATVLQESDYARDLARQIVGGEKSLKQGQAGAKRYAQRVRGTANEGFRDASAGSGLTFTWSLGPTEHCPDCPYLASLSPYTPETLFQVPGDGRTECKSSCTCRLIRSDGYEGFDRVAI